MISKKIILVTFLLSSLSIQSFAQVAKSGYFQIKNGFGAKEFSKELSLFKAKAYLIAEVLKINDENVSTQFSVEPLSASSSGQLTTLIFDCPQKNISGLILGFYGDYWDRSGSGVNFTGYLFKFISDDDARKLFQRIDEEIKLNDNFLKDNANNNNIVFKFGDMDVIISRPLGIKMRLLWNGFDSEWEEMAFNRTKRRYDKKSK